MIIEVIAQNGVEDGAEDVNSIKLELLADDRLCKHNERTRYIHGYYCRDCGAFVSKNSKEYKKYDLLQDYWMVLHNINADKIQLGEDEDNRVLKLIKHIGIYKVHANYADLINEAEKLINEFGKNSNSASVTLK